MTDKSNLDEVKRILRRWHNGTLTDVEVHLQLMAAMNEANIVDAMSLVPADRVAPIRQEIESRPRTEAEWNKFNPIRVTGIAGPLCEAVERREEVWRLPPEEKKQLREGTDLFRRYFASLQGETT